MNYHLTNSCEIVSIQGFTRYLLSEAANLASFPKSWRRHVRINHQTGCWLWTGWVGANRHYPKHKYGFVKYIDESGVRRTTSAHRFAYICVHGPVADELDVDHLCHNKLCVNPAHLEAVTHQENIRRIPATVRQAQQYTPKTHCMHGHELTKDNVFLAPDGRRRCMTCNRQRALKSLAKRADKAVQR